MKSLNNLNEREEIEAKSKVRFLEKLLILFFSLQSNEKFVHIQTIVIAFFWAIILMLCAYGAFNLLIHIFYLIAKNT